MVSLIPKKTNLKRINEAIEYLSGLQPRAFLRGRTNPIITQADKIRARLNVAAWSPSLSLGGDRGLKHFLAGMETKRRRAVRGLLLKYLLCGVTPFIVGNTLKGEFQDKGEDLLESQIRWLTDNHNRPVHEVAARAGVIAEMAACDKWPAIPHFAWWTWRYGTVVRRETPGLCWEAGLYFLFLAGAFSHRSLQTGKVRPGEVVTKICEHLRVYEKPEKNLYPDANPLPPPGTLIMLWRGSVHIHAIMTATTPGMIVSVNSPLASPKIADFNHYYELWPQYVSVTARDEWMKAVKDLDFLSLSAIRLTKEVALKIWPYKFKFDWMVSVTNPPWMDVARVLS